MIPVVFAILGVVVTIMPEFPMKFLVLGIIGIILVSFGELQTTKDHPIQETWLKILVIEMIGVIFLVLGVIKLKT